MKRARTSMSLFLGAWLAALIAGYMSSRSSVFAAGGKSCPPCKDCSMLDTWYDPAFLNNYAGMVYNNSDTPAQTAWLGTDQGARNDNYALNCYLYGSNPDDGVTIEGVTYTNATPDCIPGLPPAPGLYEAEKGTGIKHSGVTSTRMICGSVG